jgi:hypothetical protein
LTPASCSHVIIPPSPVSVFTSQLFIDFARNKDAYSASTLLGERIRLYLEGREIVGQEKVMEVLEALMIADDIEVIIKDAQLLCNGVTTNSLDRDKSKDVKLLNNTTPEKKKKTTKEGGNMGKIDDNDDDDVTTVASAATQDSKKDNSTKKKKEKKEKKQAPIKAQQQDHHSSSESEDDLDGFGEPSRRLQKQLLLAKAPPGPKQFSNGPPVLDVRKSEISKVIRKKVQLLHEKKAKKSFLGVLPPFSSSKKSIKLLVDEPPPTSDVPSNTAASKGSSSSAKNKKQKANIKLKAEEHRLAAHLIRSEAEAEVQRILEMRKMKLSVSEEIRSVQMLSGSSISKLGVHKEEGLELIAGVNTQNIHKDAYIWFAHV